MSQYKTIVMCGSTTFKEDFMTWARKFTLGGYIVCTPAIFSQSEEGVELTPAQKAMLDDMQLQKIDNCDAIFVVNKGLFIDESTKNEIQYAKDKGKKIFYMETDPETVEILPVNPVEAKLL